MKRILFGIMSFAAGLALIGSQAVSQPPDGKEGKFGKGGEKGPPRFELGQVFPPPLLDELNLTAAQEKTLDSIQADLKSKLDKLLTADQKKTVENFRPRGPGGPNEKGGKMGKGVKGGKGGQPGGDKDDKGGPDRPPIEKKPEG